MQANWNKALTKLNARVEKSYAKALSALTKAHTRTAKAKPKRVARPRKKAEEAAAE